MPETDGQLAERTLEGDHSAFEEIVERYQRLVFNIIYHYLGRHGDVEDVAQEVFLRVFRALDRYDQKRPLKHWIGRIAVNRCIDSLRRKKVRKTELFSDLKKKEDDDLEYLFERAQQGGLSRAQARQCFESLQEAMDCLSEKDRMAFVLREVEGLAYAELASMMKTSEVASRIRVSRAKKKLLAELEKVFNA